MAGNEKNGRESTGRSGAKNDAGTDRETFLTVCTQQMRCKAMQKPVREELNAHIEDQKAAYLTAGMEEKQAERAAVWQMGDPVEIGMQMDRVHRPRMAWGLAVWILCFTLLGGLLRLLALNLDCGGDYAKTMLPVFVKSCALGIVLMSGICFADYTVLGKYARSVWCGMVFLTLSAAFFGTPVNGRIPTEWLFMLFPALYGGIVFQNRRLGGRGVWASLGWWLASCVLLRVLGAVNGLDEIALLGICPCLLMLAVWLGWYGIRRIWALAVPAVPLIGAAAVLAGGTVQNGFWGRRLYVWIHPETDPQGLGYSYLEVRKSLQSLRWFGSSFYLAGRGEGGLLQHMTESNTFLWILDWLGRAAGLLLLLLFLAGIVGIVCRLASLKNRLGILVGTGCLLSLCVPALLHLLSCTGCFLTTQSAFPFLSMSGKQNVSLFVLLGLLLSIFRQKKTLPEPAAAPARRFPFRLVIRWERRQES